MRNSVGLRGGRWRSARATAAGAPEAPAAAGPSIYVPYYNYGPPPPPDQSPPGFAPSPAAAAFVPQVYAPEAHAPAPVRRGRVRRHGRRRAEVPLDALDPKASAALANLPEKEADRILDNLAKGRRGPQPVGVRDAVDTKLERGGRSALTRQRNCLTLKKSRKRRCTTRPSVRRPRMQRSRACPRKAAVDDALRCAEINQ